MLSGLLSYLRWRRWLVLLLSCFSAGLIGTVFYLVLGSGGKAGKTPPALSRPEAARGGDLAGLIDLHLEIVPSPQEILSDFGDLPGAQLGEGELRAAPVPGGSVPSQPEADQEINREAGKGLDGSTRDEKRKTGEEEGIRRHRILALHEPPHRHRRGETLGGVSIL